LKKIERREEPTGDRRRKAENWRENRNRREEEEKADLRFENSDLVS
jgi:hypothetical protein